MTEWKKYKLSEIGTIVGGATPSTKDTANYEGGDISWVTPKDLSTFTGRYISKGERNITEKGFMSCPTQMLPANSILFSSRAPIGYVAIAANEICTNQGFKSIIPGNNVDFMFLYYLLKYKKDVIEKMGTGTTFKEVSGNVMKNIEVLIPTDIAVQKKIAGILDKIDCKIENNSVINRNLLEQARLLYKSWFMDFDNNGGVMPDDWHIGIVSEIIELHDSKRKPLSGNERDKLEKIYPYYGATSIMDYVDDYLFDGIYLLLGEDGSVIDAEGYPILQYVFGKFWCNNHAHIITGKNGFSVEALYLLFSLTHVNDIVTGAVQLKISQQNLNKVEAVIPSLVALKEFDEMIQPMFGQIRKLRLENENLIKIRDSLLPKLMSGELDVSDLDI